MGFDFGQLEYLWTLSGVFLAFVCINGAFKYIINVYRGRLGERMLRRLRYDLYARILLFPLAHFRRVIPSEMIPMITADVEPLVGLGQPANRIGHEILVADLVQPVGRRCAVTLEGGVHLVEAGEHIPLERLPAVDL